MNEELPFFSPSGKLMQIEYALQAVSSGAASVGLKASNGVVLATEKKTKSILYEEHSTHKIEMITYSIGAVYSGMGPDYRQLIRRARKMAHQYKLVYGEPITTSEMVKRLATVMQVSFEKTSTFGGNFKLTIPPPSLCMESFIKECVLSLP